MNDKEKCAKNIINQLKRCEGQLRGIQKMINDQNNCKDIVTQLLAVKSNIDSILGKVVANNLIECIKEYPDDEDKINDAIKYIIKK